MSKLEELENHLHYAQPGLWSRDGNFIVRHAETMNQTVVAEAHDKSDALLIAAMHDSLPLLLESVDSLRTTLAALEQVMSDMEDPQHPAWKIIQKAKYVLGNLDC